MVLVGFGVGVRAAPKTPDLWEGVVSGDVTPTDPLSSFIISLRLFEIALFIRPTYYLLSK